jgi:hypothetical protein
MKRTLERELKVLEIVEGEAIGRQECPAGLGVPFWFTRHRAGLVSRGCVGGRSVGIVPSLMPPTRPRRNRAPYGDLRDLRDEAAGAMLPIGPS